MPRIKLAAPWTTCHRQFKALFGNDPEIRVIYDEEGPEVKLYVSTARKAAALAYLLPSVRQFGNVSMRITVVPPNDENAPECTSVPDALQDALNGNPAVKDFHMVAAMGWEAYYVLFAREVVQFFNDNMGDLHGVVSTLYEDIARELFPSMPGVFFCTDIDCCAPLGKPLGEWP